MANQIWWYEKNNQKVGPITAVELKALANSGVIISSDLIWKEGAPQWVPASKVKGLITDSVALQHANTTNAAPEVMAQPIRTAATSPVINSTSSAAMPTYGFEKTLKATNSSKAANSFIENKNDIHTRISTAINSISTYRPCPHCGAKSILFITTLLHFGKSEVTGRHENVFRCTACNGELKCFFDLPFILISSFILQFLGMGAGFTLLGENFLRYSIFGISFFGYFIFALLTHYLYPIYKREETKNLNRGMYRFLLLNIGLVSFNILVSFARSKL